MYEDSLGSLTIDTRPASSNITGLERDFDALGSAFERTQAKLNKEMEETVRETRRLAEVSREWKRMEETIAGSTAAMEKYNRLTGEADRALASGRINADQHAVAIQRLGQRYKETGEQAATSTRLAAHELNNLSYQVEDFLVQAGSGQGIFRPFIQQATQAVGAVGGVGRAVSLLTTPTALATMGVGALAVGFGVVAARAVTIQDELREFNTLLKATGQQAELTASQVRGVAEGMVRKGASRDDANAVISSVLNSRKLANEALAKDIGGLAVDMGVSMGGTAEAGKKLTDWLSSGLPGIRDMARETGALSVSQYEAARAALEHGDKARALSIAIGALKDRFDGLRKDSLNPAGQAMQDVKNAYNDLLNTAADHPITIQIAVAGADVLKGISAFIKDPINFQFPTFFTKDTEFPTPFGVGNLLKDKPRTSTLSEGAITGREPVIVPAPAGAPVPGRKPSSLDGMPVDEALHLSDLTHANDRLVEAMKKTGAERQIAVAQVQAEISALQSGKSARAAELEGLQAARMARAQMAASYADESNALSLAAKGNLALANAYGVSEAAALRQKAANDALATAAGNAAVNVAELTRKNLLSGAAQTAADGAKGLADLKRQVEWQEKVTAATRDGMAARAEVERQASVAQQTAGIRAAAMVAEEEGATQLAGKLRDLAGAYDEVSKRALDDKQRDAVELSIRQQRDQLDIGQRQIDLLGATADQRATSLARQRAEIDLRDRNIDKLSREGQEYITGAESLARQGLEMDRVNEAYRDLQDFGDRSFDSVLNKIVAAGDSTISWADSVRAVGVEFEQLAAKLLFVNPVKNAVLGTNLPTIADIPFFGGSGIAEGGRSGGGGYAETGRAGRGTSAAGGGFGGGFGLAGMMPSWWNDPVFGLADRPSADFIGPMPAADGFNPTYGQIASGLGFAASAANFIRKPSIGSGIWTVGAGMSFASSLGVIGPAFGPIGMGLAIAAPLVESMCGKSDYSVKLRMKPVESKK